MRVGIDLGGTKIEIVVLEGSLVRFRKRVATPAHDYDTLVATLAALVDEAEAAVGANHLRVGIATPGAISRASGVLKNSNTPCLNGRALHHDLGVRLAREIRIQNDANCFALSEAVDGAGRDARVVFGVILGTGVGGGLVVRGEAWQGHNAIAGELGHNPLPWPTPGEVPGPACYCGRTGCAESFLSGPALEREHAISTGTPAGIQRSAAQIVQDAAAGDLTAIATLERYYDRLARVLAALINIVDPDVIVLGGGVSKIATLYEEVPKRWGRYVFSDRVDTRLVAAVHGDASGVRGAAWLWND